MRCVRPGIGWIFVALLVNAPALAPNSLAGDELPPGSSDEPAHQALRKELLAMRELDQRARHDVLNLLKKSKPGVLATEDAVVQNMIEVDRRHTARMKAIVKQHGWPGRVLVGDDGAAAAWLLVQHADLDVDFQERCLMLMEAAVEAGEARPSHWAYLVDRVRVNRQRRQVFGTQFIDRGDGLEPQPIEDEGHVNERRKSVGLGTLAEYAETMRGVVKDSAGNGAK